MMAMVDRPAVSFADEGRELPTMTDEMVERVAKAIFDAMDISDGLNPISAETYARAAIAAMREPTEAAILEGAKAAADQMYLKADAWERRVGADERQDWLNMAKFCWNAMIDECLK